MISLSISYHCPSSRVIRTNIGGRVLLRFPPFKRLVVLEGPPFILLFTKGSIPLCAAVRSCYLPSDQDQTTPAELQGFSSVRKYVVRQFEVALQGLVIPCCWDDRHDVSLLCVFDAMGEACGVGIPSLKTKSNAIQAEVEDSQIPGIKERTRNASPPSALAANR